MSNSVWPPVIGIIPDGSRRWAKNNSCSPDVAYRLAASKVGTAIEACADLGIKILYVYGASHQNVLNRDPNTLAAIAAGFLEWATHRSQSVIDRVQFELVGDIGSMPPNSFTGTDHVFRANPSAEMKCCFVFNYSVEWDFSEGYETAKSFGWPAIDLLLRTGGDKRISEFMPTKCSYSELFFLDRKWPDFEKNDLIAVVDEYKTRPRTFGR